MVRVPMGALIVLAVCARSYERGRRRVHSPARIAADLAGAAPKDHPDASVRTDPAPWGRGPPRNWRCSMRAPRKLSLLAMLLVLLLALAACGNDPEADGGDGGAEGTGDAASGGAAGEDDTGAGGDATETETASGGGSDALVDLETVCQESYGDLEVPEGFSVGLVTDIGSVDDG